MGYTCQLPRIIQGFLDLGHNIVDDGEVHLIYSNDSGGYNEAIKYKEKFGGKLILNVLDLARHLPETNKIQQNLINLASQADIVTTISKTVQKQIKELCNLDSKVIYQPIKPVYYDSSIIKDIDLLMVGRLDDRNKRAYLAKEVLEMEENWDKIFVTCGSGYPGFGVNHFGVVSDNILNQTCNRSKIYLALSKEEGLFLPLIENIICGCVPIVCEDMATANEFVSSEFICKPDKNSINAKIKEITGNYDYFQKRALDLGGLYKFLFDPVFVAGGIIDIFREFKKINI